MNKQIIQDIEEKIEYLKGIKKELESNKNDYVIDFYETQYIEEPIDFLYIPQMRKHSKENNSVCSKCLGKGFIQQKIDKDIHYSVCSCLKAFYKYEPEKVSVTAIVDDTYYMIIHNNEVFRIPYNCVKECFKDSDVSENVKTLFYTNKDECEKLCSRLNEGVII